MIKMYYISYKALHSHESRMYKDHFEVAENCVYITIADLWNAVPLQGLFILHHTSFSYGPNIASGNCGLK